MKSFGSVWDKYVEKRPEVANVLHASADVTHTSASKKLRIKLLEDVPKQNDFACVFKPFYTGGVIPATIHKNTPNSLSSSDTSDSSDNSDSLEEINSLYI